MGQNAIYYKGKSYSGGGGGGTEVIANPEDVATDTLTKLSVDGDVYGIKSYQEITKAEYDALPSSKLTDDILYCITDGGATKPGEYYNPIIYSTTEREIGVWIDGKPLYQKTIDCGYLPNNNTISIDHNISNLDMYCHSKIFVFNDVGSSTELCYTAGANDDMGYYLTPTKINIVTKSDRTTWRAYATIQYTKTTDTPGSGKYTTLGVPSIHYSTDEQVIGTWIDGKPLYQKTIEVSSITRSTWNAYLVDTNAVIQEVSGWYADANNKLPLGYFNGSVIMNRVSDYANGYVSLYGSGTIDRAMVTARYTKTTD